MVEFLPSKQAVAGSSPVSRSIRREGGTCLHKMSIENILSRYSLYARAAGYSEKTITHTVRCVSAFSDFLGGIDDVRKVAADDLRRYLAALRDKNKWSELPHGKEQKLSGTSINTYCRAIKAFWIWLFKNQVLLKISKIIGS